MVLRVGFSNRRDTITGSSSDDVLLGLSGDDTLFGAAGNDYLDGGTGNDTMTGGTGHDIFVVDSVGDQVIEAVNQGTDTVLVSLNAYTLGANVEDMWFTGVGNFFGTGNERNNGIFGDLGNDYLIGGAGNDDLHGYDGIDVLDGGTGDDFMEGGIGGDIYIVDSAGDVVFEYVDEGNDTVYTPLTNYTLTDDVEVLIYNGTTNFGGTGNALDNKIYGGDGNDTLDGGLGNDVMYGGVGNDIYKVDSLGDVVFESPIGGIDRVITTLATYTLDTEFENLSYGGTSNFTGTGNGSANTITGGNGNDILSGLGGSDRLLGGAGDDELDGGSGSDTMAGGSGNDTYFVDSANDAVVESFDQGTDRVFTTRSSLALGANVEELIYTGSSNFTGTGNELDNLIVGSSGNDKLNGAIGNDVLVGGIGNDTMIGGLGNDMYFVDSIGDVVTENFDGGTDTVNTNRTSHTLASNVENLIYDGTFNFAGTGNALDNTIIGGTGNDTLDGGLGNDTMNGGVGNDIYKVDSVDDAVIETSGAGTDTVITTLSSYTLGSNIENLSYGGSSSFTGTGNGSRNVIAGGAGNDHLTGMAGGDTLIGGAGQDVYIYTALSDSRGAGVDRINGFSQAELDRIDLSAIDADSVTAGVQPFTFIATANFTGTAGELRYSYNGTDTTVEADTNGDSVADLTIKVTGQVDLVDTDFIGATGGMASFGGHYYKAVINPTPLSWTEAAAQAEAMGGHLVTITSSEENDFVFSLVNSPEYWSPNGAHGSWIGGYQPAGSAEPDGGWRWVTDETFTYAPWSPTEPNNADGNENVLHFHFPDGGVPIWNDYSYNQAGMPGVLLVSSYIVEFDGLTSHVPTVTELTGV